MARSAPSLRAAHADGVAGEGKRQETRYIDDASFEQADLHAAGATCDLAMSIWPSSEHARSCQITNTARGLQVPADDKASGQPSSLEATQPGLHPRVLLDSADEAESSRQSQVHDSPSSTFQLHRQPHAWSPVSEQNTGPAQPAASVSGTAQRQQQPSQTARVLPLITASEPPAASAAALQTSAATASPASVASDKRRAGSPAPAAGTLAPATPELPAASATSAGPQTAAAADQDSQESSTAPAAFSAGGSREQQRVLLAARLHGSILSGCVPVMLLAELELLVGLLALQHSSAGLSVAEQGRKPVLLVTPQLACMYACSTLEHSGEGPESFALIGWLLAT